MSLNSSTMPRLVCFCLTLSLIMLLVLVILIPFWVNKVKMIQEEIKVDTSGKVEDVLLKDLHNTIEFGCIFIILVMVSLASSIVSFFILTIRARRKQMESTHQEMNEETIEEPEVDGTYHLGVLQKEDVLVDHVNEHSSKNLPLIGKKILLVEDHEDDTTLVTISQMVVTMLGATIHICRNPKESVDYVRKTLRDQRDIGSSTPSPPFDYVLMDCEKLNISGFAATKCIRKELSHYGFRVPIMALTVHSKMEEIAKISEAEMDYYLPKPLKPDLLLEAIHHFENGKLFKRLF